MSTFDIEHIDGHTVTVTQSDACDTARHNDCPTCDCACHWMSALISGEAETVVSPSGRRWVLS